MFHNLFLTADKMFENLGFKKDHENQYGCSYSRKNPTFPYTQRIEIAHKSSGNHLVHSYEKGTNNVVGLEYDEMKAIMKKYKELKRKYRWK